MALTICLRFNYCLSGVFRVTHFKICEQGLNSIEDTPYIDNRGRDVFPKHKNEDIKRVEVRKICGATM